MKRIDQYERHLMIESQDTEVTEKTPPAMLGAACAWCGKMRDDDGSWKDTGNPERLFHDRLQTQCICPECLTKLRS